MYFTGSKTIKESLTWSNVQNKGTQMTSFFTQLVTYFYEFIIRTVIFNLIQQKSNHFVFGLTHLKSTISFKYTCDSIHAINTIIFSILFINIKSRAYST